jgi:hypothetical protein
VENVPHCAGRYLVAQAEQLTVNSAMAPRRVLGSQPQHQITDLLVDAWSAGPRMRVRPTPGDQLTMPAKQRGWSYEERRPAGPGQQPGQRGQHQPVGGFKGRPVYLPAQYRDLMAQNQWRSTNSSMSLAPPSRASWVNICSTWRSSRYINEAFTASIVPADACGELA